MVGGGGRKKRSVVIRGHPTSVALDDFHWDQIKRRAREEGVTIAALISRIEYEMKGGSLSAAIHAYLLGAPGSHDPEDAGGDPLG